MHVYLGYPHPHTGSSLDALLTEIEKVWQGEDDPHHAFDIGEFRDDSRRSTVMVIEHC